MATASRTEARHIIEGTLGCPVCHVEFPIRGGEALFVTDAGADPVVPDPETGMRLAAFLDLTDAGGFAILCGSWGAHAEEVRAISHTPLLLVNPPRGVDVSATGIVRVRGGIPVSPLSARAAALEGTGDAALTASAIAAVRPLGRVLGSVALAVPDGIRELARDGGIWIGEKSAAPDDPARRLVTLRRG